MIIIDCQQNTEEWFAEKLGKPSASNASRILTNAGKPSKQRTGYLHELAAERITGKREEGYKNAIMEQGNEREDESRSMYELIHNVEVTQVGVVYKDDRKEFLCSPDGLINNEYGLELKNVLAKTQIKRLVDNEMPSEYFSQIQFSLYVTGFDRWDYMSYCPSMRPLVIQVRPDKTFLKFLEVELELFYEELIKISERIR